MARKLYVGNLPFETGEEDLRALFARAGTVDSVNLVRDMATGRARGFAFVEMASDADAQNAISTLNNAELGGRNLTVNEARPKPERSGGFGGGGAAADADGADPIGAGNQRFRDQITRRHPSGVPPFFVCARKTPRARVFPFAGHTADL